MNLNSNTNNIIFFCSIVILMIMSSCSSKKFLSEGQYLIEENQIKIEGNGNEDYLNALKNEMQNIPHPKPNRSLLFFIPRERTYLKVQQKQDTTAVNRFILRNFAEPPSFYDTTQINIAANSFERFFKNNGYFNSKVTPSVELKKHRAFVTYKVKPGRLFMADSIIYQTSDEEVSRLLEKNRRNSRFTKGTPISRENYDAESRRITTLLRNHGYYEFYPNYISNLQLGDTVGSHINLTMTISPPSPDTVHRKYTVRNIEVFPDHDPFVSESPSIIKEEKGIKFLFRKEPQIKIYRIQNNIFFSKGDLYSMEGYNRTIRRLGSLSYYRFPSIIVNPVEEGNHELDYTILLRPNKKFASSTNFEFSFSRVQGVTSLLGLLFSNSLENRNVFGGSEKLVINFEAGIETALRSFSTGTTFNLRLGGDLTSPQFRDYTGMFGIANRLRIGDNYLLGDEFFDKIKSEGNVNLNLNFGISQYQSFYNYIFLNASYGITVQRSPTKFYDIRMLGINYWSPRELSDFDVLVGDDILFRRRFTKRLITGFLFKELRFRFESRPNRFGESYSVLANFEMSGHEIGLINSAFELFGEEKPIRELRLGQDTLSFAKYIRLDFEGRYNKAYTPGLKLALRSYVGAAIPLSKSSNIPYIKQFFSGGAYSVRAWQLRELGPGSLKDTMAQDQNILFYQAGDFKLEFNAEYRFDLFWVLEGAAFIDIGNVWDLSSDADSKTRLSWDFYKDLAIGAGVGLRFNFDFFIARFDFAYKVKTPYRDPKTNSYWVIQKPSDFKLKDTSVNFAIGYPF